MNQPFNYRHLYYFWVVAKQGGVSKAAARLGMAVQTVSSQVRELERDLGYALLKPSGRGLALTAAGRVAMEQADQIFQLGEQLPELVRTSATARIVRLTVGIADGLPKMVVHRLMQPVLQAAELRLFCHEDRHERLLADLALHRLDVVLADRAAAANPNLRVYSHLLDASPMIWYAPKHLLLAAQQDFPHSLAKVPVLLPTAHAAVRIPIDRWFERLEIEPKVVGEFEDSALLKTFGAGGMGVFPAAELVNDELLDRYDVHRIAACDGVTENYYAIGTEKKVVHPLVQRLLSANR
jgi:LysR family transcriptional activator of nhaA